MRLAAVVLTAFALVAIPIVAVASPAYDDLQSLAKDMTYTTARLHPMQATALGIAGYDGQLEVPSEQSRSAEIALIVSWQNRLAKIEADNKGAMTLVERDDAQLLAAQLTGQLRQFTVYQADRKDYAAAANSVVGAIFTQFQHLPIPGQRGATSTDVVHAWGDITSRLSKSAAYIDAANAMVTHPGHLQGITGSQELAGVPDFFDGPLTDAAKAQVPAADFARFTAARDRALVAISATKKYIDAHVATWPENFAIGRTAYDAMLRDEQLLPVDANDVERMGNDELSHGWGVQMWLDHLSQQSGVPFGPRSGGGLAPGGPALISYYRDRIAELRHYVIANDVVTVPSWLGQIQVVETPKFLQPVSPGASMNPPRLFSSETDGFYYITPPTSLADAAKRLDANEDFDRDRIWSTGAHEAMPGHFLQLSIAKRNPDFVRRIQGSGVFAEGWAFYGEEMFVQLGMYGNDLDGRMYTAQWERVRGARAVIDAKLATGEWSYRRASDYFAQQAGFTKDAADAEVAGIALNPGYVIAYTVGRSQLELIESQYLLKEGAKASMLDFHDRLLCYGTTPFAIVGPELMADLSKPLSQVRAAARY